jgi:hypothetical protein
MGVAQPNQNDNVILQTADGTLHLVTYPDSTLGLAQNWSGVEFNIFGDCCAYEAFFNTKSNLTVRVTTSSTIAPSCLPPYSRNSPNNFDGATAETNNLQLTPSSCSPVAGAPAITFMESFRVTPKGRAPGPAE